MRDLDVWKLTIRRATTHSLVLLGAATEVCYARNIWSGAISFGLVNIPVKLYSAVSRKTVRFHQIDRRTGSRIGYEKICKAEGKPVPAALRLALAEAELPQP